MFTFSLLCLLKSDYSMMHIALMKKKNLLNKKKMMCSLGKGFGRLLSADVSFVLVFFAGRLVLYA